MADSARAIYDFFFFTAPKYEGGIMSFCTLIRCLYVGILYTFA